MSGSEKRPDWLDKTDEEWMHMWKQEEGTHWFSDKYESEKQENLAWIGREGEAAMRKKRYRKWIAAAAALVLVPGTVFAAGKLYDVYVEQQGYQADLHIVGETGAETEESEAFEPSREIVERGVEGQYMYAEDLTSYLPGGNRYYHLSLNYVPEGMEYMELHGKYLWDVEGNLFGISGGSAFDLGDGESVISLRNVARTETFEAGGRQVTVMWRISHRIRDVFVVFEEEHMLVHLFVDESVSDEELQKVMENLEVQQVAEEDRPLRPSGFDLVVNMTWEQYQVQYNKQQDMLAANLAELSSEEDANFDAMEAGRVLEIGEPVSIYRAYGESYPPEGYAEVRITVEKVEILDNVSQLLRDNFERPADESWWSEMFGEDGSILPYMRQDKEYGDGVSAPYETVVNEEEVNSKLVLVTIKRENLSDHDLGEGGVSLDRVCCFTSNLVEENGSYILKQNRMWLSQSRGWSLGAPIYVERDESKSVYSDVKGRQFFFWRMDANDVQEYTLGFLIDEDRLNNLYYTEKGALEPGGDGTTIAFRVN